MNAHRVSPIAAVMPSITSGSRRRIRSRNCVKWPVSMKNRPMTPINARGTNLRIVVTNWTAGRFTPQHVDEASVARSTRSASERQRVAVRGAAGQPRCCSRRMRSRWRRCRPRRRSSSPMRSGTPRSRRTPGARRRRALRSWVRATHGREDPSQEHRPDAGHDPREQGARAVHDRDARERRRKRNTPEPIMLPITTRWRSTSPSRA